MPPGESERADETDHQYQQLRLLADLSDPAVAYLDTERRFEFVNAVFRERFGAPDESTRAGEFFNGICSPAVDEYLQRAMAEQQALRAQLDCTGSDGNTDRLRLKVVPHVIDNQVIGTFVSFNENENRPIPNKEAGDTGLHHDALRDNVERMARLGEMAAGLTHEIRQPLAAIINYASALKRRLNREQSEAAIVDLTDHIVEQAKRADSIIASARSLVGKGQTPSVRFDIANVIDDCMIVVERRARTMNVNIRIGMSADLPELNGNPHQIEQIIVNLVNNALDAMTAVNDRTLSIDVDTHTNAAAEGDNLLMRIRIGDTGPGVPADQRQSIFNAMETSKNEGMGMGLAVSRSLAERHRGTLRLVEDGAAGAAFILELPLDR